MKQYIYPNVALICAVRQLLWQSGIAVAWEKMFSLLYQYTTVVYN